MSTQMTTFIVQYTDEIDGEHYHVGPFADMDEARKWMVPAAEKRLSSLNANDTEEWKMHYDNPRQPAMAFLGCTGRQTENYAEFSILALQLPH